jgi:hypothetical protein
MGNCKDCIYWTDFTYRGYAADATGRCDLISKDNIGLGADPFQYIKTLAKIDSWGNGVFMTSPEFGCVQFKHLRLKVLT